MKEKICARAKPSLGLCGFYLVICITSAAFGQTNISSWRTLPNAPIAPDRGRFDDVFFINPENMACGLTDRNCRTAFIFAKFNPAILSRREKWF